MIIKPVSTEKATNMAKLGKYTFWVDGSKNKGRIKSEIGSNYKVDVVSVKTISIRGKKKAIIVLKEGQKIDVFDEKKKKKA